VGVFLAIALSVHLWIPAYIFAPAPPSSFVMFISSGANSNLGISGLCILALFLVILCFSLALISWGAYRGRPGVRRLPSRYEDFDRAEVEVYTSGRSRDVHAKKTFIYYGIGIFCLYVILICCEI
jgi:hypothetical protein